MIAWRVQGEGPDLVVLHGLFGSGDNWGSYARTWSRNFRVWTPDLPNHGDSLTLDPMDFPPMAQVLEQWREKEIGRPVRLLGHSLGGKTVMEWALRYPGSVEFLAVADMAPRQYDNHLDKILQMLLDTDLGSYSDRGSVRKAWEQILGDGVLAAFLAKNITDDAGVLGWKLRRRELWDSRDRLWAPLAGGRSYSGPALFLRGETSGYVRDQDWPGIRELFPQARLTTVEKAGHWLQADNPAGFQKALEEGGFFSPAVF